MVLVAVSSMTMEPPEIAASMQGPNPDSYWRSSSCAASGPVKAALSTSLSDMRVTDTSAAPGIVCLASSATRASVADSGCSPSMILLSSAKVARGSWGDWTPPESGVDTTVLDSSGTAVPNLATVRNGVADCAREW